MLICSAIKIMKFKMVISLAPAIGPKVIPQYTQTVEDNSTSLNSFRKCLVIVVEKL